jgi:signal transduction histidine kinase
VEVALAFGIGVASFAVVAVTVAVAEPDVLVAAVGVICLAGVVAIARVWGPAYAAPAAIASMLAFDWFQFPPTHAHEFPGLADLATVLAYIGVAVLIGELAAVAGRRAEVTEVARSELADEQAALRRVATLVAQGVSPDEVFAAVAEEAGELLAVDGARVVRYEGDDEINQLAGWSAPGYDPPTLGRAKLEPSSLVGQVRRTGRAARIDDYEALDRSLPRPVDRAGARAGVGAPIVVDGHLWGAMAAWLMHAAPLPATAEARLADFTELIATAISNTASRAELTRLADEQAALRRVATLIARGVEPADVFAAVAREVGLLLGVDATHMARYELDATATSVAAWGPDGEHVPVGKRVDLEGQSVVGLVFRTGRPARMQDDGHASGPEAALGQDLGVRAAVGAPIVVDRRLWGVMIASTKGHRELPADTESRIAAFTELVAMAISNTEARSELAASRARVVAAADEERRRVVRDLHDGAQQRLVHTIVTLKLARRTIEGDVDGAATLVTEALEQAERANVELRELAHGILPAVLTVGGLRAGVDALASRMPVPVENEVSVDRLPAPVEATAYFVVAEALTNVAKHAHAARAAVVARIEDGTLSIQVRDDGVGGARPDGSGLLGLGDRLAVLDGRLRVESPADGGTLVAAAIPLSRLRSPPGAPKAPGGDRAI